MSDFDKWYALSEINTTTHTLKELMAEAWQARGELDAKRIAELEALAEQLEWQGLSDDEIWDIANFLGKNKEWDYPVMFAKTIEKVLKEKNT